ncbi:hypothetical protein BTVI_43741 [Pitangus sulphuratus]|nr:hypothetical protein BTVI_43741 [Pitangus sulphuratus]
MLSWSLTPVVQLIWSIMEYPELDIPKNIRSPSDFVKDFMFGVKLGEPNSAPSLEVSKARLDGALSNLGQWKVSLPMAGGGTGWALRSIPTQTTLDSMKMPHLGSDLFSDPNLDRSLCHPRGIVKGALFSKDQAANWTELLVLPITTCPGQKRKHQLFFRAPDAESPVWWKKIAQGLLFPQPAWGGFISSAGLGQVKLQSFKPWGQSVVTHTSLGALVPEVPVTDEGALLSTKLGTPVQAGYWKEDFSMHLTAQISFWQLDEKGMPRQRRDYQVVCYTSHHCNSSYRVTRDGPNERGKAFLYLCCRGQLQGHRWDKHFATELFTPVNAMMFCDWFEGKIMVCELTGERHKGGLKSAAEDWQRPFLCTPEQQLFDA